MSPQLHPWWGVTRPQDPGALYVADSYGYRADVKYEGVAKPYEYTKPAAAYKAAPSVDYHHAINHQEDALYETPVAVNRKRSVIPKPKQINSIKKY